MLRATKKIAYDLLRSTREANAKEPKPEKPNMKIYVTLNDRVGLPFLKHWNGTRRELHVGLEKGPWEIRKYLIRVYRLKRLQWVLYRRDFMEVKWAELPKLLKIAEEGDEYQIEIYGSQKGRPNAPGSSRRHHYDKPNSRKTKRDFIWNAPDPRVNTETQVRLAAPEKIGYREEDPEIKRNIRERRAIEDQELLRHKSELLKRDKRIKPTVVLPITKDIPESDEDSDSEEPPPSPAVTPEARKAIRTLEIIMQKSRDWTKEIRGERVRNSVSFRKS
jgi:hypothetical protein